MGRHADDAGTSFDLRRTAQLAGLAGGLAWLLSAFLSGKGAPDRVLLWIGAVLLTVALVGLGLLLVRSDVVVLRIFVALALPTLVWSVLAIVRGSTADPAPIDAVFGVVVGGLSGFRLGYDVRRGTPHATR